MRSQREGVNTRHHYSRLPHHMRIVARARSQGIQFPWDLYKASAQAATGFTTPGWTALSGRDPQALCYPPFPRPSVTTAPS